MEMANCLDVYTPYLGVWRGQYSGDGKLFRCVHTILMGVCGGGTVMMTKYSKHETI